MASQNSNMAGDTKHSYRLVTVLRQLWLFRDSLVIITTPFILLPLILMNPAAESKCGYVVLLMGVYWLTGVLPMAITSLLPMVIFPLMGLEKASTLSSLYLKNGTFLLIGGIILALSIERWNLHKRVALKVLLLVGSKPRWLLLGFMMTAGFLSMWISNTATATMMIPIAKAVMEEVSRETRDDGHDEKNVNNEDGVGGITPDTEEVQYRLSKKSGFDKDRFGKGLIICIAYSSSIGGITTLTGTLPNVVLKGQADLLFGEDSGVNFLSWFVFACPLSVLCLLLAWIWLQIHFLGLRKTFCACSADESDDKNSAAVKSLLQTEYNKLGKTTFAEWMVIGHFVCLVILWLTREPGFCPGWANLFSSGVTDSLPSMLVGILLFIVPCNKPLFPCQRTSSGLSRFGPQPALLDWRTVEKNFPWSVVLLLGGGFALANVCQTSGLSLWLAARLSVLKDVPLWVASVVIGGVVSLATEIISNTAVTSVFIPVMADMGVAVGVNPFFFMILATVGSSLAFVLPVATPPNTIAYAYGNLKISHMAAPGLVLNVICVSVLVVAINTWGMSYLRLDEFPMWAESYKMRLTNGTSSVNLTILSSHNSSLCSSLPL